MNWQIKYAIDAFKKDGYSSAVHISDETILITTPDRPNVVAAILPNETIDLAVAKHYEQTVPDLDFLCGYRSTCVWEGTVINYLEANSIGWGSFGTLGSAALTGSAKTASHKTYAFSDRLIRQYPLVNSVEREFDRIYTIKTKRGARLRMGLVWEYEPTADAVRSLWDRFGQVDIIWNINPNGYPTAKAREAGHELGCEVVKWDDLKELIKKAQ